MDDEVWLTAAGFSDYEVSNHGRVKRLTTTTSTTAGRILKPCLHYRGYLHHGLGNNGKTKTVRLNRLVCATFHGPPPSRDHQAAHKDGDCLNNRADNLYWATKLQNEADKDRHGRRRRGTEVRCAVLTEEIVALAKKQYPSVGIKQLAEMYQVPYSALCNALTGYTWRHVRASEAASTAR